MRFNVFFVAPGVTFYLELRPINESKISRV